MSYYLKKLNIRHVRYTLCCNYIVTRKMEIDIIL